MAIFKSLKKALTDIENATTLKLSIKDGLIPKDLIQLENLEQIFIQSNNLHTLDCRHFPKSLKSLNIQDSSLRIIQDSLFDLENLRILNLSYCNIQSFSVDLTKHSYIESINLSNNKIECLPQNMESFTKLKMLNLSKNNISTLDEKILFLSSLEDIDLSVNKLTSIEINLNKLPKLNSLCLDNNSFSDEIKAALSSQYNIWFDKTE